MSDDRTITNTPVLWTNHVSILADRGITKEYALRAGMRSFDFKGEKGKPFGRLPVYATTGLVLQYPPTTDGIQHWRCRADERVKISQPLEGSNHGVSSSLIPRWIAEEGKVVPWITEGARAVQSDVSKPIYIVEAPLKACSLDCNGLPAIGLGGVLAGAHDTKALKEHQEILLHEELRTILWAGRIVYIVFDAGITRNPSVALGAVYAAIALKREGADVRIVTIPWLTSHEADVGARETDQGPDDYLHREGVEALHARIAEAVPADPQDRVREITRRFKGEERATAVLNLLSELTIKAYLHADEVAANGLKALLSAGNLHMGKAIKGAAADFKELLRRASKAKDEHKPGRVLEALDHKLLRDWAIEDLAGSTANLVECQGLLWRYSTIKGIWEELPDTEVVNKVASYSGTRLGDSKRLNITNSLCQSVLGLVRSCCAKPGFFDDCATGAALEGGFITYDEKGNITEVPHSKDQKQRQAYAFKFNPDAKPERYLAFLERLCRDKTEEERALTIACLTEHLGASICGLATRFQKAVFLLGKGGTGNSTIINVHSAVMPKGSVTCILPGDCEDDDFALAQLAGKRLNAIDDLPKNELRNSGKWKSAVTGGSLMASHKNKPKFTFKAEAGHLMACNVLPSTSDTSRGFERRAIVLQFNSIITEEEKNRNLSEDLQEDAADIVSYALMQLSEALKREALSEPLSSAAITKDWLKASAPIEIFFDECLTKVVKEDEWTSAQVAYEAYKDWAEANGHKPLSSTSFGSWLKGKLDISASDCTAAPYKRSAGRYYPVQVVSSLKPIEDIAKEEVEQLVSPTARAVWAKVDSTGLLTIALRRSGSPEDRIDLHRTHTVDVTENCETVWRILAQQYGWRGDVNDGVYTGYYSDVGIANDCAAE